MIIGTSYFKDWFSAYSYYHAYHFPNTAEAVNRKLRNGEIHIGQPKVKQNEKLTLVDGGQRYAIITKQS